MLCRGDGELAGVGFLSSAKAFCDKPYLNDVKRAMSVSVSSFLRLASSRCCVQVKRTDCGRVEGRRFLAGSNLNGMQP